MSYQCRCLLFPIDTNVPRKINERRARELIRFHLEKAHELIQELDELHSTHYHLHTTQVEGNFSSGGDEYIPLDKTLEVIISRYGDD